MLILNKKLDRLRNTRDLRAEILALAGQLLGNQACGRLTMVAPLVSESTIQEEWTRLLPALLPDIAGRMELVVESVDLPPTERSWNRSNSAATLERPNYRYEVVRQLIAAKLKGDVLLTFEKLVQSIGASRTPVLAALKELRRSGLVQQRWGQVISASAPRL